MTNINAVFAAALVLALAHLCTPLNHHFLGRHRYLTTFNSRNPKGGRARGVNLFAASKRNTSPKKPNSHKSMQGGGFGLSPKRPHTKNSKPIIPEVDSTSDISSKDYAILPPLEPHIQATLIPADTNMVSGSLPLEMYDRLDQIYGFPNFNFNPASMDVVNDSIVDNGREKEQELFKSLAKIPAFQNFRVLHIDPMVLVLDDFFTMEECDRYVSSSIGVKDDDEKSESFMTRSKTVGNDSISKAQRTSTTWFHHYSAMPELLAKATRLLGLNSIRQWEEPQTVRYRKSEHFTWHLDALAPSPTLQSSGGQRIATLLVYLTEMAKDADGGGIIFRDLGPLKL